MTKRWLVWMTGVVCVALAVYLGAQQAIPPHPVRWANAEHIRTGMTRSQVEALLGRQADIQGVGSVSIGVIGCGPDGSGGWVDSAAGHVHKWCGVGGEVMVVFDKDSETVLLNRFTPQRPLKPLDRLRVWLGW